MKDENRNGHMMALSENFASSARRTLSIDVAKYQEFLDGTDLRPEQKEEFLSAVWSVVVTFVELGFDVHPLQEVCGKDGDSTAGSPKAAFDQVRLEDQRTQKIKKKTGPSGGLEVE